MLIFHDCIVKFIGIFVEMVIHQVIMLTSIIEIKSFYYTHFFSTLKNILHHF